MSPTLDREKDFELTWFNLKSLVPFSSHFRFMLSEAFVGLYNGLANH